MKIYTMNALKITLIVIGVFSFSTSFSQNVDQDFSHLDKNKDGKIDKTEFENAPPPPAREAKAKKESSESPSPSRAQDNAEESASEDRSSAAAPPAPPSFESFDANGDGIIDMDEFTLNHTAIRKRPGSQVNRKN